MAASGHVTSSDVISGDVTSSGSTACTIYYWDDLNFFIENFPFICSNIPAGRCYERKKHTSRTCIWIRRPLRRLRIFKLNFAVICQYSITCISPAIMCCYASDQQCRKVYCSSLKFSIGITRYPRHLIFPLNMLNRFHGLQLILGRIILLPTIASSSTINIVN
jgi:hypothetical protein